MPPRSRPLPSILLAAALAVAAGACDAAGPAPAASAPDASTSAPPDASAAPDADARDVVVHATEVPDLHPSIDGWPESTIEIATTSGAVHRLAVKVADTPERRAHGFMEVPDVPAGTGMWFVYTEDREGGFWMKNTLVPLDIAYVSADGRISTVLTMTPCDADPCPSYPPDAPYRWTLEVPAGWFDRVGITVGDHAVEVG